MCGLQQCDPNCGPRGGQLANFDLMFEGIATLKSQIQTTISTRKTK
jgi:hypothetical protein